MNVGNKTSKASITTTSPQAVIPAASGFCPSINQVILFNAGASIRKVSLHFPEIISMAIGASGTIIHDMPEQETLGIGSGLYAHLDAAGEIEVTARYVLYDKRTPVNLSPTYVPRTIRTPNMFGNQ